MTPIILLDLNFTLVENSKETFHFFKGPDIPRETYRQWLVDLIRPYHVIMITARTNNFQDKTLASIEAKTGGWLPQEWYFKPEAQRNILKAPQFKGYILLDRVFPVHGEDPTRYLALESNAETRAVYTAHNVQAVAVPKDGQWHQLPQILPPATGRPGRLSGTQMFLI